MNTDKWIYIRHLIAGLILTVSLKAAGLRAMLARKIRAFFKRLA